MDGRGTTSCWGGNVDFTADLDLRAKGLSPTETPEEYEAAWADAVEEATKRTRPRPRRCGRPVACTCWARSGTSPGGSTISCGVRAGRRAIPVSPGFYLSLGYDLMRRVGGAPSRP